MQFFHGREFFSFFLLAQLSLSISVHEKQILWHIAVIGFRKGKFGNFVDRRRTEENSLSVGIGDVKKKKSSEWVF